MTETVVRVTTLEQWKSVLDVWFEQGYEWFHFEKGDYLESVFGGSHHYLHLDDYISQTPDNYDNEPFIEYEEFMAQQEKTMAKETYYVTQEQLYLITRAKEMGYPLTAVHSTLVEKFKATEFDSRELQKAILRYLGGDESIEFKIKEQLYRLWRIDGDNDKVYMSVNSFGTPDWTTHECVAFTATREEIEKWQTPAWEIEKAD